MNVTKRGNVYQYQFEIAKINGKRQRISKSGFKTRKEAVEAGVKAEAEKILKNSGFKVISSINENKESTLVSDQVPKPGVRLLNNSIIYLYAQDDSIHVSVTVPDLKGMSREQAINSVRAKNLNIKFDGDGSAVITQDYMAESAAEQGTIITVTMKEKLTDAH